MEDFDEKFLRKSESFNLKKFLKYDVKLQELSKLFHLLYYYIFLVQNCKIGYKFSEKPQISVSM